MKRRRQRLQDDPAWLARVRHLRAAGLSYPDIAAAVRASLTTVWEALNPEAAARRAERRRAWNERLRRQAGVPTLEERRAAEAARGVATRIKRVTAQGERRGLATAIAAARARRMLS